MRASDHLFHLYTGTRVPCRSSHDDDTVSYWYNDRLVDAVL